MIISLIATNVYWRDSCTLLSQFHIGAEHMQHLELSWSAFFVTRWTLYFLFYFEMTPFCVIWLFHFLPVFLVLLWSSATPWCVTAVPNYPSLPCALKFLCSLHSSSVCPLMIPCVCVPLRFLLHLILVLDSLFCSWLSSLVFLVFNFAVYWVFFIPVYRSPDWL